MEFGLTTDQTMMQESIDRTLARVAPLERVRKAVDEPFARDVFGALVELGVPGILIPEDFGGLGLSLLDAALAAEMLGKHVAPVPFVASAVMAPLALISAGTDAQKKTWLPKLARGEAVAGVAVSEHAQGFVQRTGYVFEAESDGSLIGAAKNALLFAASQQKESREVAFIVFNTSSEDSPFVDGGSVAAGDADGGDA